MGSDICHMPHRHSSKSKYLVCPIERRRLDLGVIATLFGEDIFRDAGCLAQHLSDCDGVGVGEFAKGGVIELVPSLVPDNVS